jgi:hypothetical protein
MTERPPARIEAAAHDMRQWLQSVEKPTRLPAEQIARMSWAERLDYARRFDQTKMPEWQDPRKG